VFIKETIRRRLGGQDQVTLVVKGRFQDVMGLHIAEREPQTDCEALTLFFRQSDGPNWKNKEQWIEKGVALSAWYGVTTGDGSDDKITELALIEVGIATIGASIGYLDSLTNLDLSRNAIEGALCVASLPDLICSTRTTLAKNHMIFRLAGHHW
jgi:hypothetical protein